MRFVPGALALGLVMAVAAAPAHAAAPEPQRIAIPSYFPPGPLWDRMGSGAPTVGTAILNPDSGPGDAPDQAFADQVKRARDAGIRVLGYVKTGYAGRDAGEVKAEIDRYREWYGVGGIFLDETTTGCDQEPYYEDLHRYVKQGGNDDQVVLNPGTGVAECYMKAGDVVVNFESEYQEYTEYAPDPWVRNYPAARFWHLVHSTTEQQLPDAMARSEQNHAGSVYVTPDVMDNPWDTLPPDSYWTTELSLAR